MRAHALTILPSDQIVPVLNWRHFLTAAKGQGSVGRLKGVHRLPKVDHSILALGAGSGFEARVLLCEVYRANLGVDFAIRCITFTFIGVFFFTALQERVVKLTGIAIDHLAELSLSIQSVLGFIRAIHRRRRPNLHDAGPIMLSQPRLLPVSLLLNFELLSRPCSIAFEVFVHIDSEVDDLWGV